MAKPGNYKFKDLIKKLILNVLIFYSACARRFLRRGWTYFVLPPADPGSLGDQALTQAVQDWAKSCRGMEIRQVLIRGFRPQVLQHTSPTPVIFEEHTFFAVMSFVFRLSRAKGFFVLGADVLDGRHHVDQSIVMLDLCALARRVGVETKVLGFSFSEKPNSGVVAKIKQLPDTVDFNLRDQDSLERFERFTTRPGNLVADLAFLLRPNLEAQCARKASEWLTIQEATGRRVVGINVNVLTSVTDIQKAFEENQGSLVESDAFAVALREYTQAIVKLFEGPKSISFLLIPHDMRRDQSDFISLKKLRSSLPDNILPHVLLLDESVSAWDVKALVGGCDVILTARMHLAIAALGMGIPPVCISYVGKFRGLLDYFQIPELCLDPQIDMSAETMAKLVSRTLEQSQEYRARISKNITRVQRMSMSNFDFGTTSELDHSADPSSSKSLL